MVIMQIGAAKNAAPICVSYVGGDYLPESNS